MVDAWWCVFVFKQNTANHVTSLATGFAASSTIGTCKPNFCSSRSRKYFKCADCAYHVICSHSMSFGEFKKIECAQRWLEHTWTIGMIRFKSTIGIVWQFDLKHFQPKWCLYRGHVAQVAHLQVVVLAAIRCTTRAFSTPWPFTKKTRLFRSSINSKFLIPRVSKVPILIFFNFWSDFKCQIYQNPRRSVVQLVAFGYDRVLTVFRFEMMKLRCAWLLDAINSCTSTVFSECCLARTAKKSLQIIWCFFVFFVEVFSAWMYVYYIYKGHLILLK